MEEIEKKNFKIHSKQYLILFMIQQTKKEMIIPQQIILFVCFGNVHRSVLAEEMANNMLRRHELHKRYRAISRGVQGSLGFKEPKHSNLVEYKTEWELTKKALVALKVDTKFFAHRHSTPIDVQSVMQASIIVAMDKKIFDILRKNFPEHVERLVLFSTWLNTIDIEDLTDCDDEKKHLEINKSIVDGTLNELITKLELDFGFSKK